MNARHALLTVLLSVFLSFARSDAYARGELVEPVRPIAYYLSGPAARLLTSSHQPGVPVGLFDQITAQVQQSLGTSGGTQQGSIVSHLIESLGIGSGTGLAGLVQKFQKGGLGDIVSSWVSTGPNAPVSPAQVSGALGNDAIAAIAAKLGVSPEAASSQVATVLPALVDKLTPGGKVPEGDLLSQGLGVLKGMMG